jgi:transcriptional regulator with XRE-family HTH domain
MADTIGKRIATARHEKGWTQDKLASEIGIPQSQLSEIETNIFSPKWELIEKIADKLEVSIYKILPTPTINVYDNEFKDSSVTGNIYHQKETLIPELLHSISEMTTLIKEMLVSKNTKEQTS